MKKNGFKVIVTVLIVAVVIVGGLLIVKNVKGDGDSGKSANGDIQAETEQIQDMQITEKSNEKE